MPRPAYVGMTLTRDARDALQRLTLNQSARVSRRLPLSTVLLAAITVAEAHPQDVANALDIAANGDTT